MLAEPGGTERNRHQWGYLLILRFLRLVTPCCFLTFFEGANVTNPQNMQEMGTTGFSPGRSPEGYGNGYAGRRNESSRKPGAANSAKALWLTIVEQWRRVADLEH